MYKDEEKIFLNEMSSFLKRRRVFHIFEQDEDLGNEGNEDSGGEDDDELKNDVKKKLSLKIRNQAPVIIQYVNQNEGTITELKGSFFRDESLEFLIRKDQHDEIIINTTKDGIMLNDNLFDILRSLQDFAKNDINK
jgi:hypothetical protein